MLSGTIGLFYSVAYSKGEFLIEIIIFFSFQVFSRMLFSLSSSTTDRKIHSNGYKFFIKCIIHKKVATLRIPLLWYCSQEKVTSTDFKRKIVKCINEISSYKYILDSLVKLHQFINFLKWRIPIKISLKSRQLFELIICFLCSVW